jgi:DNA-binding response OmpR family regulator
MTGSPSILVVDDEAGIRQQLRIGLTQRGFEVECAGEGVSAVERIQSARQGGTPHDYVVMDMRLPDIDGRRLMEVVNTTYPEVGLIAISGFGSEYDTDVIDRMDGCVFLDKPFGVDDLVDAIRRLGPRVGCEPLPPRRPARTGVPVESAYVVASVSPARLRTTFESLLRADGVCYCDAVCGDWDVVILVQGADGAEIRRVIEDRIARCDGIQRSETLVLSRPTLSHPLASFIQSYERKRAARCGKNGLPQPRRCLPLSAYALLTVDGQAIPSLYPRLYFNPDVVYCDVAAGGDRAVVLLQASTSEGLQRAVSTIEKEAGVRKATVLKVVEAQE